VPVVHTFHALGVVKRRHQGALDTSPPGRIAAEERIGRRSDHVIATATDEVFELLRMGVDVRRVSVVPCGVDLDLFRPVGPTEQRPSGRARIVVVSRLVQRKGVGNVISALAELPGAELVIAGGPEREELGSDPEARRLAALAEEVGLADRVQLRGRVGREELPPLLRSADVAVCVPWYEPFGIVPLEAMACGVPVVASAVGGLLDTVVDGETGVLVPPRSPERLAEVLAELLADPAERERMGRAGVERTRARYSWGLVADQTLRVYESLPRRRSARRTLELVTGERARDSNGSAPARRSSAEHLAGSVRALACLVAETQRIESWGRSLARTLLAGGRLLAVGNGGSAAQAQHLTGELVGRYSCERPPLSAIPLHGDTSTLTAIENDYGAEEAFARQVRAHGRPGDVLFCLSTSGRSPNVLAAARAAAEGGLTVWGLTGPAPNPLADLCDDVIPIEAPSPANVQELHLVAVHLLCAAVDEEVESSATRSANRHLEGLHHGIA
jgi:type III pantothenate kinase